MADLSKTIILEWQGYRFFKTLTADVLKIDNFLSFDLYPKFHFENREGLSFSGLGQIVFDFQDFKNIPQEFFCFIQKDFSSKSAPQIILPQLSLRDGQIFGVESVDRPLDLPQLKNPTPATYKVLKRTNLPEFQDWVSLFQKIELGFKNKIFEKIVPARRVTFKNETPIPSVALFEKIKKSGSYNFYYSKNSGHAFLGASPERLFAVNDNILETEAVAGTRPLARGSELLSSEKDLYEHQLVVKDVMAKIKPFTREIQKDEKPRLIEAKNLAHLKTNISAQLHSLDILGLLDAIHPTSAVCGMPKAAAQDFLAAHESFDRGSYAGAFGVVTHDLTEMAVTIRSCEMTSQEIHIYSGVGVVPQSECELEWQELEDKIKPYLDILSGDA